ncbi:MAG: alpha amylase C-terminal domain-containing protein [Acidobacteria bacterium]|nr:alpha amylase C-terminal domain-containing protein [Acidobacteriota bacterium]
MDRVSPLVEAQLAVDPSLEAYRGFIYRRLERVLKRLDRFTEQDGGLIQAANAHQHFGLHPHPEGWILREWAPNAVDVFILCAATHWKADPRLKMQRQEGGVFEIILPRNILRHGDLLKLMVTWQGGAGTRIPAFARRVVQTEGTENFDMQVWSPAKPYVWCFPRPERPAQPLIYEAHIGMAQEHMRFGSYDAFRLNVLPRIARSGYNTVQLMALAEHPYYGSFGYHVTNFFAPSSRFGTPDSLKAMIDTAHGMGISVIMDLVHSHAARNKVEGLSHFDGTEYQYFHAGPRGYHSGWDTRCFDYGKEAVQRFLLSNCRYWLEEFNLDGFRFDGVTSMLYHHHGLGKDFGHYQDYYSPEVDEDAVVYLALANRLIHQLRPEAITLAEDVSGLPGLALPAEKGGLGFDYRLAMGIPDYWIRLIKEKRDEAWHMGDLYYNLTNHRPQEPVIAYAESHDQALVGDQTLIFRMIGHHMYDKMSVFRPHLIVDRGVALHKMIRLITLAASGSGYLNFMGNEFGHPEWIDFPREGNQWSHHYARRQWSLSEDSNLHYQKLGQFDRDMLHLIRHFQTLTHRQSLIMERSDQNLLAFMRGSLLFVFNFHPTRSHNPLQFEVPPGTYTLRLNSGNPAYSGNFAWKPATIEAQRFETEDWIYFQLECPIPARTALVFERAWPPSV